MFVEGCRIQDGIERGCRDNDDANMVIVQVPLGDELRVICDDIGTKFNTTLSVVGV